MAELDGVPGVQDTDLSVQLGPSPPRIALAIATYFDHGGLQRDCIGIARALAARGWSVEILAGRCRGSAPGDIKLHVLDATGLTNHGLDLDFARRLRQACTSSRYDLVVGFDPVPGLDVYFAGQASYADRMRTKSRLRQLLPRYRARIALETGVFAPTSNTRILALTKELSNSLIRDYGTAPSRIDLIRPSLDARFRASRHRDADRASLRAECRFAGAATLCLFVGSRFITKGLDRALRAIAHVTRIGDSDVCLVVAGDDRPDRWARLAKQLGIEARVRFLGGRDDIPRLMTAADILIHPAREEATGGVLIEAMATGLPILCTAACGYANHVRKAGAGRILSEPFDQAVLDHALAQMLASPGCREWSTAGIAYAEKYVPQGWREDAVSVIEAMARKRSTKATRDSGQTNTLSQRHT